MVSYLIRRLLQAVLVLIIVTFVIFTLMRVLPGNPILMYVADDEINEVTPEELALLEHQFGLDKPLHLQYIEWISNVVRGDLGTSIVYRSKVIDEVSSALPKTLHLGALAFIISALIGIPAGVISAVRRGTWLDTIMTTCANIGIAVPVFWMGILMIYLFGFHLRWLPIFGYVSPFEDFWLSTKHVIMPAFCLATFTMAAAARQTRSSMLEIIRQDYIRTAWAKGLGEFSVIMGHAMKNALIPVITLMGMHIRIIFGGAVVIETVFSIPGMGRLAVDGIFAQDYAVIQGCILIVAIIVTLSNLVIDLSYGFLDPRIRYN